MNALKIGIGGRVANTNFEFGFQRGKLRQVTCKRQPDASKPSLIDANGAYQLATQWLAAVDIDMAALNKLKWTVNQVKALRFDERGMTNYVTLPLYAVDFSHIHYPPYDDMFAFDGPQISVGVLGATKELQWLMINDFSLTRRPPMLVTNVLEMIHTPIPPISQMRRWPNGISTETNWPPPRHRSQPWHRRNK